jgi:hypothetical protein
MDSRIKEKVAAASNFSRVTSVEQRFIKMTSLLG